MSNTKIEWAQKVWNPITGCSKISPGCQNCYAERMTKRLKGRYGYSIDDPFHVTYHSDKLSIPLHWKKHRIIFVSSMGDLFHEFIHYELIASIFGVMAFCQNHTFLILTKRPDRLRDFFKYHGGDYKSNYNWWLNEACLYLDPDERIGIRLRSQPNSFPLPNVWLGVTAENQEQADKRIPLLLQIPAAVHFVSVEPMLGQLDLTEICTYIDCEYKSDFNYCQKCCQRGFNSLTGEWKYYSESGEPCSHWGNKLDWVIAGCESGPKRRPAKIEWFRNLRDQCVAADVPFFLKQMEVSGKVQKMPELSGKIWDQMPK